MCTTCAMRQFREYNQLAGANEADVHYGALGSSASAFQVLGNTSSLLVVGEDVAGDITTTSQIYVDEGAIRGTLNTIGDYDFFKVELVAGRTYEFAMLGATGGTNGLPLIDAYVELYDAAGNLITGADGGASTTLNSVNSGFDAVLTYKATQTGTFYINARAFDQDAANGNKGDFVGDYTLAALDVTDNPGYVPYYDAETSPLHSLDWGSQVNKIHQSVRNPDGQEGPRATGNPFEMPAANAFGVTGKNVITVYFAKAGEVYIDSDPTTPGTTDNIVAKGLDQFEKDAFEAAFRSIEKVADIDFIVVDGVYDPLAQRAAADFTFVTYAGTPRTGLLGRMSPPDEDSEGQAEFNALGPGWDAQNLVPGGFSYVTLIHEMGHGLGMAHPHDTGGRSSIMRGVVAEGAAFDYTTGDFNLNQGVHTMMSYEDGWVESPYGNASTSAGYGYNKGPMAFDIAVLQDKYGVNEETATGDDVYRLSDVNARGTGFESIWDAGGTDAIVYDGARDATIDLRAATLKYEVGGGGRVSFAAGIFGGFTIANSVTIENAQGGSGNDKLIGNAADNRLTGGGGKDALTGGAGRDVFAFAASTDSAVGANRDVVTDFIRGEDKLDFGGAGGRTFLGTAAFSGVAGQVNYVVEGGKTLVRLDSDGDRVADLEVELTGVAQLDSLDFVALPNAPVRLVGTAGADVLRGLEGDDLLMGLGGDDVYDGGEGNDTADLSSASRNGRIDIAQAGAQNTGEGNDTFISIENVIGGSGSNQIYGTDGRNRLEGRGGADLLDGRGGDDVLVGGAGRDQLIGRAGSDIFVFENAFDSLASNPDRINDYTRNVDKIDLSGIDAIASTAANDAFTFIGNAAFSKTAGQLRYEATSAGTLLSGDVNGDGVADFSVLLANRAVPLASDILL